MLYWFYSTVAQSCVALVAFVAVIYIFREQKLDNKITYLFKNIFERMRVFGDLRYAPINKNKMSSSVNKFEFQSDLSIIIKNKPEFISEILKLGIEISRGFQGPLMICEKLKELQLQIKTITLRDLSQIKNEIVEKGAIEALEKAINELEPVIKQVELIELLHNSSGKLRNRFVLSTIFGLITFLSSCFGIIFTNNNGITVCMFPIIAVLLIALVVSLLFFFFKGNEKEKYERKKGKC
jgi:hypothetical protein